MLRTSLFLRSGEPTVLFAIWAPVIKAPATAVPVSESNSASEAMATAGLGKRNLMMVSLSVGGRAPLLLQPACRRFLTRVSRGPVEGAAGGTLDRRSS